MSIRTTFEVSLVVLTALLVALVVVMVLGRAVRQFVERRRCAEIARLRPLVLRLLDDDAGEVVLPTKGRDGRAVEAMITGLLPKLRGIDRDALAQVLLASGTIDEARKRLRSRRAARRLRAVEFLGSSTTTSDSAQVSVVGNEVLMLLNDPDGDVRMAAARALGRLGHPLGVRRLVEALDDRSVPANTVSMALMRIGDPGTGSLIAALDSRGRALRPSTVAIVVELLGVLGCAAARPVIEDFLSIRVMAHPAVTDEMPMPMLDPAVRRSAVRALGRLGVPASSTIVMAVLGAELRSPTHARDLDLSIACVTTLGQLGDRRAIPLLTDSLALSHRLSYAAAVALAAMGPRRSRQSMRERDVAGERIASPVTQILCSRQYVLGEVAR